MPPQLAAVLNALDEGDRHVITHLRDRYEGTDPGDPVWIGDLAREGGWVIISGDERIRSSPANKAVWRESRLTAFFFVPPFQNSGKVVMARELLHWWPTIVKVAKECAPGTGFRLPHKGSEPKRVYEPSDGASNSVAV